MRRAVALLVTTCGLAAATSSRGYEEHYAVARPKGTVIVVHGGSWRLVGKAQVESIRPVARRFAAMGYEVYSIDYRAGRNSVSDILNRYREIRRMRRKVCLYGESAGGHLAMLTAELAGNATCVIAAAAPTDLETLGGSPTRDPALLSARAAFGNELRRFSPLRHAWPQHTPLTLIYARYDPLVDISQGRRMARHANGRLLVLGKGNAPFIHSGVSHRDLEWATNRMFNRLASAMTAIKPGLEPGAFTVRSSSVADHLQRRRARCSSTGIKPRLHPVLFRVESDDDAVVGRSLWRLGRNLD